MSEFLVILACLNHSGCSETSSQYYSQHPELQEFVKTEENKIRQAVSPIMIQYALPILYAASGNTATARLSTRFYFTFKLDQQMLLFKQEF